MRHLDIKSLWLQKDVRDGLLEVVKIPGTINPADLMAKILTSKEIEDRLEMMNIKVRYSSECLGRSLEEVVHGGAGNHVRRLMGWASLGKDGNDELEYYRRLASIYEKRIHDLSGQPARQTQRGSHILA